MVFYPLHYLLRVPLFDVRRLGRFVQALYSCTGVEFRSILYMLIFQKVRSNYENLNNIRHTILYNENILVTLNPSDKPRWTWYDAVISRVPLCGSARVVACPTQRWSGLPSFMPNTVSQKIEADPVKHHAVNASEIDVRWKLEVDWERARTRAEAQPMKGRLAYATWFIITLWTRKYAHITSEGSIEQDLRQVAGGEWSMKSTQGINICLIL